MPIYEYKCSECESHFEKLQKSTDEPLKVCEKCGGSLEKQWSLSGFQFKGEGWYVTDYADKKKNGSATTSSKSDTNDETEKKSTNESTAKTESASKDTSDKSSKEVKKETKKD